MPAGGTELVRPHELLSHAREIATRPNPATAGLWPRAAAFMARQALESALASLWGERAHGLEVCSMRAQLLCLEEILSDRSIAAHTRSAWGSLTRACHHHPYELPPTAAELAVCFDYVEELVEKVQLIRVD